MRLRWTNPIAWTAGVITLAAWLIRLPLLRIRYFDPDEFQHTHNAWSIALGQVPFRDFVDHHTPLFHYFLAAFFRFHDVASSAGEGEAMLFLARRVMWLLSAVIVVLTFDLARRWRGAEVAWVATALLSTTIMFVNKTLEIRPDLLTMIFWLGSLILILEGTRSDGRTPRRDMLLFAVSGASIALGLFSSQKLLFAGPSLAATMAWYVLDGTASTSLRRRLTLAAAQIAGFAIVIALGFGYFASQHTLSQFLHYNIGANIGLADRFSPLSRIRILLRQNPYLVALGAAALLMQLPRLAGSRRMSTATAIIVLNTIGLAIGLFLNPVPYEQSFLTLLPLLALLAADFLVVTTSADRRTAIGRLGLAAVLAVWCTRYSLPVMAHFGWLVPLTAVAGLGAYVVFYLKAMAEPAVAAMVAFLGVYPLAELRSELRATNSAQLQAIRAVYAHSTPTDTFLDGFTGYGVFRPHASRFWFLHREMQAMMTPAEREMILRDMESGLMSPRMIGFDRSLRSLSPELNQYIATHYDSLGVGPLFIRK